MLVLSARPNSYVTVFGLAGGTIYIYRDLDDQVKIGFCYPKDVRVQRDRVSYEEFDTMLKKYSLGRDGKKDDREGNRKINS